MMPMIMLGSCLAKLPTAAMVGLLNFPIAAATVSEIWLPKLFMVFCTSTGSFSQTMLNFFAILSRSPCVDAHISGRFSTKRMPSRISFEPTR